VRLVRVYEGYTILLYQGWVGANLAQAEEYESLMAILERGSRPKIAIELGLAASFNCLVDNAFFIRIFQFDGLDLFFW